VGSLEKGTWSSGSGFIIAGRMGDANASIPTPQPVIYKNFCFKGFAGKWRCGKDGESASGPGMQEYLKKIYGTATPEILSPANH